MPISIRNQNRSTIAFVLVALLFTCGCASGGGGNETAGGASVLTGGRQVGDVSISFGDGLAEDVTQMAAEYSIISDLDAGIRRELTGKGLSDSGLLSVDVEIVGLRVRTTATAIWWGVFAGADTITVQVSVVEDGQTLKTFESGTSTSLGGFGYGGRGKRITRMLNTLSKRIALGI